ANDQLIDLPATHFSNVGGLTGNVVIADGVVIEDAIGGTGSDSLIGNDASNLLLGGSGNDFIAGGPGNDPLNGGAGIDSARFSGPLASYTINRAGNVTVSGPDGSDTLTGIEKAVFDDQTVLLGQGPTRTDFNSDLDADLLW